MAPSSWDPRDRMIENLKVYGGMSAKGAKEFKDWAVALDYFRRDDHLGGVFAPGEKYRRADGKEHTYRDVKLKTILEHAEFWIKTNCPQDQRTDVFNKVTASMPGPKRMPKWDKPIINPHEKPETPFSTSRAPPKSMKSNGQLIEDLVSAADLNPSTLASIRGQITWWDGLGDDTRSCILTCGSWTVSGGRLGRDHKLEDVPNHFVRDCVMSYINTQLPEDKRDKARSTVFSDLTEAELATYAADVEKKRIEREMEELEAMAPKNKATKPGMSEKVAASIQRLNKAVNAIDEDISLSPLSSSVCRDMFSVETFVCSVIKPGMAEQPCEESLRTPIMIDRDADQVRAMIKIFTREGSEWTIDKFRVALFDVERPKLAAFLEQRGPKSGIRTRAFQVSWKFFKRRELLGLPLTPVSGGSALREVDVNRGPKKRQAVDGEKQSRGGKRHKSNHA